MAYRNVIFPLVGTGNMSQYATGLSLTMDSNYVISAQLTNKNGEYIGTEQTIDLPLESVIVSGSYDSNTQSLILTLDNGNEIIIPVSDLISGLQAEITAQNPLSADLLTDGNTNKVFTATEQTKLSGLAPQVQSDWNQTNNQEVDFIKNKPTIPAAQVNSDWNASSGVAEILNKPNLATVATSGDYDDLQNKPSIPAAQVQSDWNQSDNTQVDFIKNKPSIPAAQVQSDWNQSDNQSLDFIKNKPTIPAAQVNADWNAVSGVAQILNKPSIPTVNDSTITIQQDGTTVGTFTTNDANDTTINLTGGGGGNDWYGTQIQFDALGTYDADTNYYITDKLNYNTDLKNTPDLSVYATKTEVNTKNASQDTEIAGKLSGHFMTQQEFDALGNNVPEGENYFIQGDTIQMVVTFTDQTTATYNVVVD